MKGIKMTTNAEVKIQEVSTELPVVNSIEPTLILEPIQPKPRKRYSHETVKEYARYKRKLTEDEIQYEKDLEKYKFLLEEEQYKLNNDGKSKPITPPVSMVGLTIDISETIRKQFKKKVGANNTTCSAVIKNWINLYNEDAKITIKPSKAVQENEPIEGKNTVELEQQVLTLKESNKDRLKKHMETKAQLQVFIDYATVQGKTLEEFTLVIKQKIKESHGAKTE